MTELVWTPDVDLEDRQECVVHFVGRESGETNLYTEMGEFTERLRTLCEWEVAVEYKNGWIVLRRDNDTRWYHVYRVIGVVPLPHVYSGEYGVWVRCVSGKKPYRIAEATGGPPYPFAREKSKQEVELL